MTPRRPRLRRRTTRVLYWASAALALLSAAGMVFCLRYSVFWTYRSPGDNVELTSCGVWVFWNSDQQYMIGQWLDTRGEVWVRPVSYRFKWMPLWDTWRIYLPLWIPAAVGIVGMATTTRHRTRPGCCPSCGYSLTGLATDRLCPECGHFQPKPSEPPL